ncbi:MAG: hypothetical protein CL609_24750 [Anaerolineaceae bacterium]|nr:hypothetical protein [Anaerolineaceae bacterium]
MRFSQHFKGLEAFYAMLIGQLISTIGSGMTRFGLGVWVLSETGNTTDYTTMLFFAVFPAGIGSLFSGPFIDRWDRKKVMIFANIIASLSTLLIVILYFMDILLIWHLYIALSVNGIANAFISPSLQSSTRLLVPKNQLNKASGLAQLLRPMETIIAPGLAGFIVGVFGLGVIFIIDFVTFVVSVSLLLMTIIPLPKRSDDFSGKMNFWSEFISGIRYIKERPAFIFLMVLFTVTMFLLPGMAYSLVTPMVLSFQTERVLGLILSAYGLGSIIGGVLLTLWSETRSRMSGILTAMTFSGIAAIIIGLWENPWTIGFGFFLTGMSFIFVIGLNRVIWQIKSAPEVQGRIFSLMTTLGVAGQALGILAAGPLVSRVFGPMLETGGKLTNSVGLLIGVGPSRGMALLFILLGFLVLGIVLISSVIPSFRNLESHIPDYDAINPNTNGL